MPDDLGKRLVDAGTALAPDRHVDPTPIAAAARRSHRRRRATHWGALTVLALVGAGLVADRVVRSDDSAVETADETALAGGWEQLPDPPLSPRGGATAVWTGAEVVVFGGSEFLCPPGADCGGPVDPPFSDGAAYDPTTEQWRSISPAPMPIYGERAVAVDGAVYLLLSCDLGAASTAASAGDACAGDDAVVMLSYDVAADEWTVLDAPPNDWDYELAAAGSFVVAYSGSDESGEVPDWLFDTSSQTWQEVPDDPLPAVFDRTISTTDDGETLILIGAPRSAVSDPAQMNVVAQLDVPSGRWDTLPSPPSRGFRGWGVDDDVVLEPHFGGHGGVLDPEQAVWSSLPAEPAQEGWENGIIGVVGQDDAVHTASTGWVLDLVAQRWIELEPPDERQTYPDSNVTAVGRDLFLFGGERWDRNEGQLLGDAWIWRAPGVAGTRPPTTMPR